MLYAFLFIIGAVFGSFLNVCIYRIPRAKSIVTPRSHCPKCEHKLPWYENIPILSFILLRGRCSKCKEQISFVYPTVEIITALLAVTMFLFFGATLKSLIFFMLFSSLVVATFIDFERQEIPDVITLPGIIIGLFLSVLYPALMSETRASTSFINSLLGVLVGGGSLYLMGFFGEIVFKKDAMGGGDIKLLAMIGAFLGWQLALLTFFIAPFFGAIPGIALKIKKKKEVIPYGPYISLAAFVSLLWGGCIIRTLLGI